MTDEAADNWTPIGDAVARVVAATEAAMALRPIRWGHVPVPITAMWTGELEARCPRVRRETWGGHRLAMLSEGVDAPGLGKPLFKMLHADRCRAVLRSGLCQMCCEPLPRHVVTMNQGQADTGRPLISDGLPMCPACGLDAYHACPGLQRQAREGKLRIWWSPRGAWVCAPVILGAVSPEHGGDERINALLARVGQVWTGPKLVLTEARVMDHNDLWRAVEWPLKAAAGA